MQRMMERMAAMTPEEYAAQADSSFALAAQTGSMWDRDAQIGLGLGFEFVGEEIAAIVGPHTAIKVFSPNAFGWQVDAVPGGPMFLQHGGVGGWQPNAGLAVGVILPGTDVQTLRPGQTVPARLAANPDDADDEAAVVYARWTGAETRLPDGSYAFQGDDVSVRSRSLAGTFEVTDVTGAEVRGRLRLSGSAHRLTEHYRYTRDGDGRIDGDTVESNDEQTGPLTIDATVRLPAAVEVQRPGRFIERTARVGSRR